MNPNFLTERMIFSGEETAVGLPHSLPFSAAQTTLEDVCHQREQFRAKALALKEDQLQAYRHLASLNFDRAALLSRTAMDIAAVLSSQEVAQGKLDAELTKILAETT